MRVTLTIFWFFSFIIYSNGQHVLTATNSNPLVGDVFEQDLAENVTNFNPGAAGANITWNFSNFNAPDTTSVIIKAATDPNYASADIYFTQAGADAYFATSNAAFQFYGFDAQQVQVSFTDPEDQIRYPFAFGDSFTDTKSGSSSGFGQTAQRSGNIQVEADAYGTLITPDGNYPNVLRLKYVRNDTDYFNGTPINIGTDTIFYWYSANFRFPIMSYVNLWQNGSQAYSAVTYIQDNSFGTTENTQASVRYYPNPTKGSVELEGLSPNTEISLFTINGERLESFPYQKIINLKGYRSGIYILQVENVAGIKENLRVVLR